jgi:hypothetical protein
MHFLQQHSQFLEISHFLNISYGVVVSILAIGSEFSSSNPSSAIL